MTKVTRARYTLEFKQEAVWLVESGQSIAASSRTLGLVEQTLFNWVKAHRKGTLKGVFRIHLKESRLPERPSTVFPSAVVMAA